MTQTFALPEKPATPTGGTSGGTSGDRDVEALVAEAFGVDRDGVPTCQDARLHFDAWTMLSGLPPARREEIVGRWRRAADGIFAGRVAPHLVPVPAGPARLGSDADSPWHYWGEDPAHDALVSAFAITAVPVTNALYRCFRPRHDPAAGASLPAAHLTWYDAVMFARWVGARLPREAEWEVASRCGAAAPHGDISPDELTDHAWFSENARGQVHEVATRRPNRWGIHDLFGNVWEWCADAYDPRFYRNAPLTDPFNDDVSLPDRVSRGGSLHAFAEMCRSAFRNHEPADYSAHDIGFRLAVDADGTAGSDGPDGRISRKGQKEC